MANQHDKSGTPLPESKINPLRRMKVREAINRHTRKDPTHPQFDQNIETPVPWINLRGLWLRHAGFEIGTPITIVVTEGCMVISADTASGADRLEIEEGAYPSGEEQCEPLD